MAAGRAGLGRLLWLGGNSVAGGARLVGVGEHSRFAAFAIDSVQIGGQLGATFGAVIQRLRSIAVTIGLRRIVGGHGAGIGHQYCRLGAIAGKRLAASDGGDGPVGALELVAEGVLAGGQVTYVDAVTAAQLVAYVLGGPVDLGVYVAEPGGVKPGMVDLIRCRGGPPVVAIRGAGKLGAGSRAVGRDTALQLAGLVLVARLGCTLALLALACEDLAHPSGGGESYTQGTLKRLVHPVGLIRHVGLLGQYSFSARARIAG